MKVLITGGFGYIGGRLAQHMLAQGHEVLLGSRCSSIQSPAWLNSVRVVQTKWSALDELEEMCASIDAVVHLAGMNAQECTADPVGAIEFNAGATARLLQSAIRQRVKRFVYLSTAHVYGSPLTGIITEETCPISLHPYATSHRAAEDIVRAAHQKGKIKGIIIRLSNAYGAPMHTSVNCWMLLVNDLCRQAVTTRRMVLQSSGKQKRDFISMTDVCKAIDHLLKLSTDRLGDGLFNVGGGWTPTVLEMAQRVVERIYSITDNILEILRKEDKTPEGSVSFQYRMGKLTKTGFRVSEFDNINTEIDGLIRFCLRHFTTHL